MDYKIALLAGEFHRSRVELMLDAAREEAQSCGLGVCLEQWVPGSFEVPLALYKLLSRQELDAVAVLGIIERGETKHGLVMAQAVFPKILDLELQFKKPVGLGIIGPEVLDHQIEPRLVPHAKNAVRAVRKMLDF